MRSTLISLPLSLCERVFSGEAPLKAWSEHRNMLVTDLRKETGIGVGRIEQLMSGKGKKMDEEEERLLARALDIDRACLRPMSLAGCSALDVDEDAILAEAEHDEPEI